MRKFLRIKFLSLAIVVSAVPNIADTSYARISLEHQIKKDRERDFHKLIDAVIWVESRGNTMAIGAVGERGILQIRESRLKDYNHATGKAYTLNDLFREDISKEIFLYYANRIGIERDNWEDICRQWNGGSQGMRIAQTEIYWNKVQNQLTKI